MMYSSSASFLVLFVCFCYCEIEFNVCQNGSEFIQTIKTNVEQTFDINIKEGQVAVCLQSTEECRCHNSNNGDNNIPQIIPLVIEEGAPVKLTTDDNSTVLFYSATEEDLMSCNVPNNETLSVFNITSHSVFPSDLLKVGTHHFTCTDVNNRSVTCETGCRISITVKLNTCKTTGNAKICNGNGICTTNISEESFTCKCYEGFAGGICETETTNITATQSIDCNECQNGGTCVNEIEYNNISNVNRSTTTCKCPPSVTGEKCETILNECKSSPCVKGVCVEHEEGYKCYCVPGFHGKQCELEYNECLSNPCKNGGTCIDRVDKFECRCLNRYTGTTCQNKIDLCTPNPCLRNANCTTVNDDIHCNCPHHLTGKLCEQRIKSCASNPCRNHGTCIEYENGHQCMCPVTFAGMHCEYMMDVFAPPMEGPDVSGETHKHNLYIVAGTLGSMVLIVVSVIIACYCKIYETYKQLMWRRLRYHRKRSNSCPDLETSNEPTHIGKHRLSADAIWEATSLCHDNAAFENNSNHQTFGNTSLQI